MLIERYDDFAFDCDGFVKMIVAANLPADSIKTIRDRAGVTNNSTTNLAAAVSRRRTTGRPGKARP
jgi:hypothetical protein